MVAISGQPRLATMADRRLFLELSRAHAEEEGVDFRVVRDRNRTLFEHYVQDGHGVVLVMDDVGYVAWGEPQPGFMVARGQAHGFGAYIKPEYRDQGHGTRLFREAARLLKERGFRSIVVTPGVDNPRAIRILESIGFEQKQVIMVKKV